MKSFSKAGRAGRKVSAAAAKRIERVSSAPVGAGLYSVSEKDPAGRVVITARAGRTTVPANMANMVIRAAMELTGLAAIVGAQSDGTSAVRGSSSKTSASQTSAVAPPRASAARASKPVAPAAKSLEGKSNASRQSAAPVAAKTSATSKGSASKGSTSKGSKTSAAKAPAAPSFPVKKAVVKKVVAKRAAGSGRGPAKVLVAEPQSKSRIPKAVSEFNKKFESRKGQAPHSSLTRHFFDQEKRWGYKVEIARDEVGKLLFEHDGVWYLMPTDGRLVEAGLKMTDHANPIAAFVRVTNAWSRALTAQTAAAA